MIIYYYNVIFIRLNDSFLINIFKLNEYLYEKDAMHYSSVTVRYSIIYFGLFMSKYYDATWGVLNNFK